MRVNRYQIAAPEQLLEVVNRQLPPSLLVIGAHGTDAGICLPPLAPEIAARQPLGMNIGPAGIGAHFKVPGRTILSLACGNRSAAMAEAWLSAGAAAYLAPDGEPQGEDALLFALVFYWLLLCLHVPLTEAHQRAAALGRDTGLFKLRRRTKRRPAPAAARGVDRANQ